MSSQYDPSTGKRKFSPVDIAQNVVFITPSKFAKTAQESLVHRLEKPPQQQESLMGAPPSPGPESPPRFHNVSPPVPRYRTPDSPETHTSNDSRITANELVEDYFKAALLSRAQKALEDGKAEEFEPLLYDEEENFRNQCRAFVTLVAGGIGARNVSEVSSIWTEPSTQDKSPQDQRIRGILDKLAIEPLSNRLESVLQVQKEGVANFSEEFSEKLMGAPEVASDEKLRTGERTFKYAQDLSSDILNSLQSVIQTLHAKDPSPRKTGFRVGSGEGSTYRPIVYPDYGSTPKGISAKDYSEVKTLALERLKTTPVTAMDLYLLRLLYPGLFRRDDSFWPTAWPSDRKYEEILSHFTPRASKALLATANFVSKKRKITPPLSVRQIVQCTDQFASGLFSDICVHFISIAHGVFNTTASERVSTINPKRKEIDFGLKLNGLVVRNGEISWSIEKEDQASDDLRQRVQEKINRRYGVLRK